MTRVREAAHDLFGEHGRTTMVGNPGSTESPMLRGFPDGWDAEAGGRRLVEVRVAQGMARA